MSYAEKHPSFREQSASVARWVDRKSKQMARPLRGPTSLGPELEEIPYENAVQQGCMLLGEVVVYTITGAVLLYEFSRQKDSERKKMADEREAAEHRAAEERAAIERRCKDLLMEHEERYEELRRSVKALESEAEKQDAKLEALQKEATLRINAPGAGWWRWLRS